MITPQLQVALAVDGQPGARRLLVRFEPAVLSSALGLVHDRLEQSDPRAATALREAGYHDQVTIHVAPALDTLASLGPGYDLAYIDADKPSYVAYLRECTRLVRPGGIIVADNVFGGLGDAAQVALLREFAETALADPALSTVVLPVGDGITLSTVL